MVCNAGISASGAPGMPRTVDGVETIFGVNHLGHFLLVNLLLNRMGDAGRIVFVTSDLHDPPAFFPVKVTYDNAAAIANHGPGMQQYCTSKLCNIYCAYEMTRRLSEQTDRHITVNAFNPGAMSDTGFARPADNALIRGAIRIVGGIMGKLIGSRAPPSHLAPSSPSSSPTPRSPPRQASTSTEASIRRHRHFLMIATTPRISGKPSMAMTGLGASDTIFPAV